MKVHIFQSADKDLLEDRINDYMYTLDYEVRHVTQSENSDENATYVTIAIWYE